MSAYQFATILPVVKKCLCIGTRIISVTETYITTICLRRALLLESQRSDPRYNFRSLEVERAKVVRNRWRRLLGRTRWNLFKVAARRRECQLTLLDDLDLHIFETTRVLGSNGQRERASQQKEKDICRFLVRHV